MAKRKKRIVKQIEGLEKIKQKHFEKLENEQGRKDTTHDYWKAEIRDFEKEQERLKEKLEKIRKQ